ncbi:BAG family molecular chaperone regulator 5, mitochondrial [Elaeis guineensis]|uniref:BAG family molecular chaperone regulator 5, mitochondrial n=1 Tax=Elaeis guineensis var. tenera TaxID=51953 RepID=A0A6I9RKJ1_ELAGV|nr:BAG family molecular chaperone regulator 5, mitochondrial [Elaeis guineensis]
MDSYHYHSTSFFYFSTNDQNAPQHPNNTILIPIETPSSSNLPAPIPVHLPAAALNAAAVKIQSAFRGHLVRSLIGKIRAVDAEAGRMERLIQRQETVDAVRRDERERLRVSEGLMALLLRLDSVPGFYPAVRELRRSVSRRIVGLQEVLDLILGAPAVGGEGFPASLEEIVEGMWRREGRWGEEEEMGTVGNWERGFGCLEKLLLGV